MSALGDWSYQWVKGRVEAYVKSDNREDVNTVIKAIVTMSTRYGISDEALKKMLDEVYSDTVLPFLSQPLGSQWRQPERLERFTRLKSVLLEQIEQRARP
jgi:hypothetical protein